MLTERDLEQELLIGMVRGHNLERIFCALGTYRCLAANPAAPCLGASAKVDRASCLETGETLPVYRPSRGVVLCGAYHYMQ